MDDATARAMAASEGYSNEAEREFARAAIAQGWSVTKRGWPDFICRRGDEIMAVEVKDSDWLSEYQRATAVDLAAHGIPVHVWHIQDQQLEPVSGVQQIMSERECSVFAAADEVGQRAQIQAETCRRLERKLRNREARIAQVSQLEGTVAKLTDDIGYLLRRIDEWPGFYKSARIAKLMRRHRDLLSPVSGDSNEDLSGGSVEEGMENNAADEGHESVDALEDLGREKADEHVRGESYRIPVHGSHFTRSRRF